MIKAQKNRNYVAKNMPVAGSGRHEAKKGQLAPRNRQKKEWKREVQQLGA